MDNDRVNKEQDTSKNSVVMDAVRNNSKQKTQPMSSIGPSRPSEVDTKPPNTGDPSPPPDEEEKDSGSDSQEEESLNNDEGQLKMQRQREKRLAMNRASARERRKRKRLLIEELQQKSQQLACSNLSLRRVNEELRGQVAHLTAILTATQPALASVLSVGNNAVPAADPAAASLLATPGADALAVLQQQEAVRALLDAQDAAAAQSMPLGAGGVLPTAVQSANELAHLQQQQQHALLSQQLGNAAPGASPALLAGGIPAASLLDGRLGHHAGSDVLASSLPQHALSGPVSNLDSNRLSHLEALQRRRTALEVLQSARTTGDVPDKSVLSDNNKVDKKPNA